jgi:hypothetical protein
MKEIVMSLINPNTKATKKARGTAVNMKSLQRVPFKTSVSLAGCARLKTSGGKYEKKMNGWSIRK